MYLFILSSRPLCHFHDGRAGSDSLDGEAGLMLASCTELILVACDFGRFLIKARRTGMEAAMMATAGSAVP